MKFNITVEELRNLNFKKEFVLTTRYAALYLGNTRQTLVKWHASGKLIPFAVNEENGWRFYYKTHLDEFKKNNK